MTASSFRDELTDALRPDHKPARWHVENDDYGYAARLIRDDGLIVHLNPGTECNRSGVPALIDDLNQWQLKAKLRAISETHRLYHAGHITSGRDLCDAQKLVLK